MLRRIFCIDPHIREVTYEPKHVATYGIVPLDWYFAYLHIFAQVYQYQRSGSTPDARKMNVIVNVIDWGYSSKYSITIQYPQHALPSLATTGRSKPPELCLPTHRAPVYKGGGFKPR